MKVFISWSGKRSCLVAEKLRGWLVELNHKIIPWMSKSDIDAGARWPQELAGELETTSFGISILTPENTESAWLNFEAGALSKQISDSRVCTYLVAMTPGEIPAGPLTQFQAKVADERGTLELMRTLNKSLGDDALESAHLERQFGRIWPELAGMLAAVPAPDSSAAAVSRRPLDDMIEELIAISRQNATATEELRRFAEQERLQRSASAEILRDIGRVRHLGRITTRAE